MESFNLVVVIDDSDSAREVIQTNLIHRFGYKVVSESDAASGLQQIRRLKYKVDVILLDYHMPGANGLDFFRELLNGPGKEIPVVMLTASDTVNLIVEFMKMGGADFIQKPIMDFEILDFSIKRALSASKNKKQLREAEAARIAAEQSRDFMQDFVAKMSHELGTPSHHISSAIHLINKAIEQNNPEKVQKWLKTAEASNLRLKRLVKDIMDLTQIQRGKFTVNRQDTALKKLIQTAVTEVMSQNPSFEGRIETNIDDIIVNCDGDRITQVLVNLLNNSMRYAPNSEVISVQLKTQNGNAIYSIADMGPGISNDKQEKVFQPFFQCRDGFNYSGSLGLGLSISKEIIEHHEGSISVQANHPKGAKFIFTLPLSVGASI